MLRWKPRLSATPLFIAASVFVTLLNTVANAQSIPTFTQSTYASRVAPGVSAVVKADLNNDGVSDLVFCCDANSDAWYQLSSGTGAFLAPTTLGPGALFGNVLVTGDFNNDGWDDVLVIDNTKAISIYYNNGNGSFTPTKYFPNANALEVTVADFNHDGNLDIAYIPNSVSPVQTFLALGDGKGNFSGPVEVYNLAASNVASDLVVGDFDGDHNADLAFVVSSCARGGCGGSTLYILYGNGAGQFAAKSFTSTSGIQLNIASFDVNQDGRSDLAVTTFCSITSCPSLVGALFGNSSRNLSAGGSSATGSDFNKLRVADFNGDLKNDFVDSYGSLNTLGAFIALASSNSSWTKQLEIPLSNQGGSSQVLITGDFNSDRKPDIVVFQAETGLIQELQNTTATGNFGSCSYPAAGNGINICAPVLNTAVTSPVLFRTAATSFQPIRKTELWIDGHKITEQYRSWLDYSTQVASGSHKVDIYVSNYDDDHQHTSFSFTVN